MLVVGKCRNLAFPLVGWFFCYTPLIAHTLIRLAGNLHTDNLDDLHQYNQQGNRDEKHIRLIAVVAVADGNLTQTAAASLKDVDVTMMLFEPAGKFTDAELTMVKALQKGGPAIAVINKVDLLDNFAALEARKKQLEEFGCFDHIVTISAKDGTGCDELFAMLKPYGNEGPHYFDDDAFTDMPEKELVAELVREKALLFLREEVPHGIAVVVERFKERPDKDLIDIDVDIYCERKSHKGMIIGKGGQMLKKIASAARMDIEELLGVKVNLQCWVKVREDWRDNELQLNSLGFAKP